MNIAVVGAGFSGLRAAMLLEAQGHQVTVYEARDRVGGRAHSVRGESGFYEAGGEWIDSDHSRCLNLLQELGLTHESHDQWPGRLLWRDEDRPEDEPWPSAVASSEALESWAETAISAMPDEAWEHPQAHQLDHETLGSKLRQVSTDEASAWYLNATNRSDEGEDPDRVGLLGWLVGYRHYLSRTGTEMSAYRFGNGAQAVCEAMEARLGKEVLLSKVLKSVANYEDHVELWFGDEVAFYDACVLTLPPKVLLDVDFGPDLPLESENAWQSMGSARAIKVVLEFSEPIWERKGWKGRLLTDTAIMQSWSGGRNGLHALTCYICGDLADATRKQKEPEKNILESLESLIPGSKGAFVRAHLHDWIGDPFSKGAFSSLAPGSVTKSLIYATAPVGRTYFAGEWTATWAGFYEGALESAERVANQIQELEP